MELSEAAGQGRLTSSGCYQVLASTADPQRNRTTVFRTDNTACPAIPEPHAEYNDVVIVVGVHGALTPSRRTIFEKLDKNPTGWYVPI